MSSKTKRYIALFLGTLLISLGVSLFLKADLGVDPFTLFNLSLSKQIGVTFSVILSLGAGMYISAQLGLAPYDIIAIIISERTNIRYRWIRIGADAICVIVGVFLKEPFGIGTVLSAFFLGPLIEFFRISSEKYLDIDKTLTLD